MMHRGRAVAMLIILLMSASCADGDTESLAETSTTTVTPSIVTTTTTLAPTTAQASTTEVAAALLDEWVAAWEAHDADQISATFTIDGVYVNPFGEVVTGRDEIHAYVLSHGNVRNGVLGELVELDVGLVRVPFAFEALGSDGWKTGSGDLEVELDGDLAARIEFITFSGFH